MNEVARRGRLARSAGTLTLGKVAGDLFTFVFFVVLSRTFGQEGLGRYSFAMALTGFLLVGANCGLYYLSIKEMSRRRDSLFEYFGKILSLRIVLVSISLVVLFILAWFSPTSPEGRWVIVLIGVYQIGYTLLNGFSALFVVREETHLAALLELSLRAITMIGGIAVATSGGSLVMTVAALPAAVTFMVVVALTLVARRCGMPRIDLRVSFLSSTLRESSPYALSQLLTILSSRMDVLFLGVLMGAAAAGSYNAAYRVIFLLTYLAHLVGVAILPRASTLFVDSREELDGFYHRSIGLGLLAFLPAAAGMFVIAPRLVSLIYGEGFAESSLLLRLLCWLLLLSGLKALLEVFLMASDRQVDRTRAQWHAAWVNVVGNSALIPTLGITGAAIATLISESLLVVILLARLRPLFGWPRVGRKLLVGAAATGSFFVLFLRFSEVPLIGMIAGSVGIYVGILALFPQTREDEGRMVAELLTAPRPIVTEGDHESRP